MGNLEINIIIFSEVQDLVAKRSIEKGEEITLSYVPAADEGSDERKVRMNYLVEWYGFICNCQACSLKVSYSSSKTNLVLSPY
jgi:hypothetical protein